MTLYISPAQIIDTRPTGDSTAIEAEAAALTAVGMLSPIVVTRKYRLIEGALRLAAARRLNWRTVPIVVADPRPGKTRTAA